jgi:dienelactone hydrolase
MKLTNRKVLVAAALIAAPIAFVAARCDPRAPGAAAAVEPELSVDGGVRRLDVRFPCGECTCAGWLYLPPAERPPVVVMAHGFAGTRDVGLPATAESLARGGLAAFVFDYCYFGASGGRPRQIVDPWQQLDDWRAAITAMRARGDVDGTRLALFGSSLGGGHALLIAAEDRHLRAVVAQAPLIDTSIEGEATYYGAFWVARLLTSAWGDFILSAFGRDPVYLAAIARPGGFGMIVDDAAYAAFERLVTADSSYRNAVAARSIFLFDDYNPNAHTAAITAPVLLIASRTDRFAPFAAVQAYADRAANVSVETFEGDHFDVYSPPAATRAAEVSTHFLASHLR